MVNVDQVRVVVDPLGRVDRKNAARALMREPKTLANWALNGIGPQPFKVAGRVFYRWDEVQAFGAGGEGLPLQFDGGFEGAV